MSGRRSPTAFISYGPAIVLIPTYPDRLLAAQVIGDIGDDDVFAEEERALDHQRGLVVQEMLPPLRGNELRDDDGDHVMVAQGKQMVEIVEQRAQEHPVG